ncbi:MAG: large conductance mechanosensitive channel protein MscL [Bacillota bacterium]|nr:large conductance mechanosensitive channel protein MscL [Bacillota bacterium]
MKRFINEFKEFAVQGNVMDMAVGIVVGAAFTAIVTSLVNDIISPVIGLFVKLDFTDLVATAFGVEIRYGAFIMAVINFLIVAFVLFIVIRAINRANSFIRKPEEAEPTTKACPFCRSEIAIDAIRCPNCTSQLE